MLQQKTQQPVQFKITEQTCNAVSELIKHSNLKQSDYLFNSQLKTSQYLSTRQYARIVGAQIKSIGLNPIDYGTHFLRRTKPTPIYQRTKNIRAIQILLGHTKLESTVRYLGIEVDDTLEIAEQTEV